MADEELADLKQNLRVSFSRMKDDISSNKEMVAGLIELNKQLASQVTALQAQIQGLQRRPVGLKSELIKHYERNRKGLIKQRILSLIKEGQYSVPQLKEVIVDEKMYCSKASFYRYIETLRATGWFEIADINGSQVVVIAKKQE